MKTNYLTSMTAAFGLLLLPAASQADDFSWNSGGGTWSTAGNWIQTPVDNGDTPGATDNIVTPTNNGFLQVDPASVSVLNWTYANTGAHLVVANSGPTTINVLGTMTLSNGNFTSRNSGSSLTTWDINHLDVTGSTSNGHALGVGNGTSGHWIESFTTNTMNVSAGRISFRVLENGGVATVTETLTMSGDGEIGVHWSQAAGEDGILAVGGLSSASATNIIQVHHGSNSNEGLLRLNNGDGVSTTYAGILRDGAGSNSNTLSVEKNNAGTQEFSGTGNIYTGTTTVNGGTLLISGQHDGGDAYTIDGGTLAGDNGNLLTNIITANDAGISLNSGASLAMGTGTGTTGIFSASLTGGVMDISGAVGGANTGALVFDLAAIGSSDQFQLLTGTLDIGTAELEFTDFNFTALAGIEEGEYVLFDTTDGITGTLGANLTGTFGGFEGTLGFADGGNDLVLTVATAIPEPTSAAMLVGALGLLALRRRRA